MDLIFPPNNHNNRCFTDKSDDRVLGMRLILDDLTAEASSVVVEILVIA